MSERASRSIIVLPIGVELTFLDTMMFEMTGLQHQAVYNTLSHSFASVRATNTMYLWFQASAFSLLEPPPQVSC